MKFAFGVPALILYPAIMSPWEPAAGGAEILRIARHADALGFDWLTIPEHIVMPRDMVEVMGARFPEGLTAAAVLAGATERVRLLTYVLVLPYRNPVLLAKQIATLDFLTGGRITLGTASGHLEREFATLGVPYAERGARTDEYLRVLKELWTNPTPSFHGRFVEFDEIAFEPRPVQQPHPPIFIGGNSRPAMRRAAAFGDGWLPWLVTREQLPGCLAFLRDQPGFAARADTFEVVMPLASFQIEDYTHREVGTTHLPARRDEIVDEIGRLAAAGTTVTQVVAPRTASLAQLLEWMTWFAEEVLPQFRSVR
jgi:probable F420-dependent oxidoreductase